MIFFPHNPKLEVYATCLWAARHGQTDIYFLSFCFILNIKLNYTILRSKYSKSDMFLFVCSVSFTNQLSIENEIKL